MFKKYPPPRSLSSRYGAALQEMEGEIHPKAPVLQLSVKRRLIFSTRVSVILGKKTVIPFKRIQLNPLCGPRNT